MAGAGYEVAARITAHGACRDPEKLRNGWSGGAPDTSRPVAIDRERAGDVPEDAAVADGHAVFIRRDHRGVEPHVCALSHPQARPAGIADRALGRRECASNL